MGTSLNATFYAKIAAIPPAAFDPDSNRSKVEEEAEEPLSVSHSHKAHFLLFKEAGGGGTSTRRRKTGLS